MFSTKKWIAYTLSASFLATPFLLTSVQLPMDRSLHAKPATVRVLLCREQEAVLIEARGRHIVYDPSTLLEISRAATSKRARVIPTAQGIQWKELFPSMQQIRIVPGDSQSTLLINGIEYRGCIEIYNVGNKLNIVNEIDAERYLKSTLTFQFPQDLDEEVADALAIVARTQLLASIQNRNHPYYDVEASEVLYQGHALTMQNLTLDKAVQRTHEVILTYQGKPFQATWTGHSGGKTADYTAVFRKNLASPPGVTSPFAANARDKSAWSFTLTKAQFEQALNTAPIHSVHLYQDPKSEKIYGMKVQTPEGSKDLDFFKLQSLLGAHRLRSNDFSMKLIDNEWVIRGFGEGHGVGLCLFSATAMAENGATAQKILNTFFPGTQLERARL